MDWEDIIKISDYEKEVANEFAPEDVKEADKRLRQMEDFKVLSKSKWMEMLKLAGAVTSTTAGLETKPRYRRRRKKEEEDDELE
tara:strand:- start:143 stop:394 length:252 start_codon:yes stop_codon:yes gene_type:complete